MGIVNIYIFDPEIQCTESKNDNIRIYIENAESEFNVLVPKTLPGHCIFVAPPSSLSAKLLLLENAAKRSNYKIITIDQNIRFIHGDYKIDRSKFGQKKNFEKLKEVISKEFDAETHDAIFGESPLLEYVSVFDKIFNDQTNDQDAITTYGTLPLIDKDEGTAPQTLGCKPWQHLEICKFQTPINLFKKYPNKTFENESIRFGNRLIIEMEDEGSDRSNAYLILSPGNAPLWEETILSIAHPDRTWASAQIEGCCKDFCYIDIKNVPKDAYEDLIKWFKNNFLIGNRTLLGWRTHMFRAYEGAIQRADEDSEGNKDKNGFFGENKSSYFFSHVKESLQKVITSYDIKNEDGEELTLCNKRNHTLSAEIKSIRQHSYKNNDNSIDIVEWGFHHENNTNIKTADDLLEWNAGCRYLYSPYISEDKKECFTISYAGETLTVGEAEEESTSETGWWKQFFSQHFKNEQNAKPLWDERALVFSSCVFEGNEPEIASAKEAWKIWLHRFAMVDPAGAYWMYGAEFSKEELHKSLYERFAGFGSYYASTSHSFCYAGFGEKFALLEVHKKHMPNKYYYIFLLAQIYRATLAMFDNKVSQQQLIATPNESDLEPEKEVRNAYVDFTNKHWFPVISSTEQGKELNERIWERTSLQNGFDVIDHQLSNFDEARERIDAKNERISKARNERIKDVIQWLGMPFVIFLGIMSLSDKEQNGISSFHSLAQYLKCNLADTSFLFLPKGFMSLDLVFFSVAFIATLILSLSMSVFDNKKGFLEPIRKSPWKYAGILFVSLFAGCIIAQAFLKDKKECADLFNPVETHDTKEKQIHNGK
jgi:hypothetical protein